MPKASTPSLPVELDLRRHQSRSLWIAILGWCVLTLQELFLFLRPTALGGHYVEHWDRYFFHAILFNTIAVALVSLPFWLIANLPGKKLSITGLAISENLHRFLLSLLLIAEHFDHEIQRFVGSRLSVSLLVTYRNLSAWGDDNLRAFVDDAGGVGLPIILVLISVGLFVWLSGKLKSLQESASTKKSKTIWTWPTKASAGGMALILAAPILAYNVPGGSFRKMRVRPVPLQLYFEWEQESYLQEKPENLDELTRRYQSNWLRENGEPSWHFDNPNYPFWRSPVEHKKSSEQEQTDKAPYNLVYLQVESLRAWDVGFLRTPAEKEIRPNPTPFLDELAADPHTAYWTRHMSFGPPTVGGFMAGHCSIRPHSLRNITTSFTYTNFLCFPELLKNRGYRAEFFTATDPDWDHHGFWARKWFDEVHFYRHINELDRELLQRTSKRLVELGRASIKDSTPFVATVVTASNHFPFRSRESDSDITGHEDVRDRILNTEHYTDDSLREFFSSLQKNTEDRKWFERTIFIIVGDHAYNLGEHDHTPGQRNGYHESVWVPLIIHGNHPRLRSGRHDHVASLLDIAPTIADLLEIEESNPWIGHSLLAEGFDGSVVTSWRRRTIFAENPSYSFVVNPDTGEGHLFGKDDAYQKQVLPAEEAPYKNLIRLLKQRMRNEQRLSDYLIESNLVAPSTAEKFDQAG